MGTWNSASLGQSASPEKSKKKPVYAPRHWCISTSVHSDVSGFCGAGLKLPASDFRFVGVTNDVMRDEGLHYITLFTAVNIPADAVIVNAEPTKCDGACALGCLDGAVQSPVAVLKQRRLP